MVRAWLGLGMGASRGKPRAATAGGGAGSGDDVHLPPSQSYWQVSITAVTGTPEGLRVLNSQLEHHVPADLGFCSSVQQREHPPYSQHPHLGNLEAQGIWRVCRSWRGAEEERTEQQGHGPALGK